jgi:hypothetical protein
MIDNLMRFATEHPELYAGIIAFVGVAVILIGGMSGGGRR